MKADHDYEIGEDYIWNIESSKFPKAKASLTIYLRTFIPDYDYEIPGRARAIIRETKAFQYPHIHIIYNISIFILYRKTSQLLIKILNTKFQSN